MRLVLLAFIAFLLNAAPALSKNTPPSQEGCHWGKKCVQWAVVCTYWEPYGSAQPAPNSPACHQKEKKCIASVRSEVCPGDNAEEGGNTGGGDSGEE